MFFFIHVHGFDINGFVNFSVRLLRLLNVTNRERLVFHSIQYRNDWLAASDHFSNTNNKVLYIPLSVQRFENCDSSNRQ